MGSICCAYDSVYVLFGIAYQLSGIVNNITYTRKASSCIFTINSINKSSIAILCARLSLRV